MTEDELDALAEYMSIVNAKLAELTEAINVLGQRKYRGAFSKSESYFKGNMVSWHGELWHCTRDNTNEKPGTDDWQLMTKEAR